MTPLFLKAWDERHGQLRENLRTMGGDRLDELDYEDLLKLTVATLFDHVEYSAPDPEHITEIDYGNYSGTLVFVVGEGGYEPQVHWVTTVGYGSCSGCDTLAAIRYRSADFDDKVSQLWTLCLHMVQSIQVISGYEEEPEDG